MTRARGLTDAAPSDVHAGGPRSCAGSIAWPSFVEHPTFHHNVPMFLEREDELVPLLKRELLELLRDRWARE